MRRKVKKDKKKSLSFSKALVAFVMGSVVEVIIFAELYLWIFTGRGLVTDVSPLYVLITSVVAAGISAIVSMMLKSKAENTAGGIVYETALREQPIIEQTEEESVG